MTMDVSLTMEGIRLPKIQTFVASDAITVMFLNQQSQNVSLLLDLLIV